MNESAGEARFLAELDRRRFFTRHMTCTTDGFSDIIAVRGRMVFFIEAKDIRREKDRLIDIFEPAQPQFYHRLSVSGFLNSFLLMADEKKDFYRLYRIGDPLLRMLADRNCRIDILGAYVEGAAEEIVGRMEELWL